MILLHKKCEEDFEKCVEQPYNGEVLGRSIYKCIPKYMSCLNDVHLTYGGHNKPDSLKCGTNKFCVGHEGEKIYCYGKSDGCKWNENDCSTDSDCSKYTTDSLKFTDAAQKCPNTKIGWMLDACPEDFASYIASYTQTKSGKTCQKWTEQTPHSHTRTPKNFPNKGLGDHNKCRNPDNAPNGLWCYTTDSSTRWDYC